MKLIAIEGPDKVGKATQTALLVKALHARGYSATSVEIPFNDECTYKKIYAMLRDGSALDYPLAFQAFQGANRMICQRDELKNLKHYDVVVLDRWDASSWVYGRAAGLDDKALACVLSDVIPADYVFVLKGAALDDPTDTFESNVPFMARVRSEYQRWAEEHNAIIIHADRDRETVSADILHHCQQWL